MSVRVVAKSTAGDRRGVLHEESERQPRDVPGVEGDPATHSGFVNGAQDHVPGLVDFE